MSRRMRIHRSATPKKTRPGRAMIAGMKRMRRMVSSRPRRACVKSFPIDLCLAAPRSFGSFDLVFTGKKRRGR